MASNNVYSASFRNLTVDASSSEASVMEVRSGTSFGLELMRVWMGTDVTLSNVQEVTICYPASAGTAGTLVTPVNMWDPSAGTAADASCYTGRSNLGMVSRKIIVDQFNVLNGWLWIATKRDTIRVAPSSSIDIRFEASIVGSQEWWGGLIFREL